MSSWEEHSVFWSKLSQFPLLRPSLLVRPFTFLNLIKNGWQFVVSECCSQHNKNGSNVCSKNISINFWTFYSLLPQNIWHFENAYGTNRNMKRYFLVALWFVLKCERIYGILCTKIKYHSIHTVAISTFVSIEWRK